MNVHRKSDELFKVLHRAGWSVGDTAFAGPGFTTWLVYGTQSGYEVRAEAAKRPEAWEQACRQARELGLIDPL